MLTTSDFVKNQNKKVLTERYSEIEDQLTPIGERIEVKSLFTNRVLIFDYVTAHWDEDELFAFEFSSDNDEFTKLFILMGQNQELENELQ